MPDPDSRLRDAFLSYSTADRVLIERIRDRFDRESISHFYAPADIERGVNFVSELEKGLTETQVLVAFLSPASLQSF